MGPESFHDASWVKLNELEQYGKSLKDMLGVYIRRWISEGNSRRLEGLEELIKGILYIEVAERQDMERRIA